MTFPAMMFLLGFLCATLLSGLVIPPLVRSIARKNDKHRRKMPEGVQQAVADKDRLRAEFALSLRKREHTIEKLQDRGHSQLVEIAARNAQITTLKKEIDKISDLADRRYHERENLRHNLETIKTANETQSNLTEPAGAAKGNIRTLEPENVKLPEISESVLYSSQKTADKDILASRIAKLKSPE